MNKFLLRIAIIAFTSLLMAGLPAKAQIDVKNLASTNVDLLSDQQIIQLLQQAKAAGLTDDQVLDQARTRGVPPDQVSKLSARISRIRSAQQVPGTNTATATDTVSRRSLSPQTAAPSAPVRQSGVFQTATLPIFGSELFSANDLRFEPNLKIATPLNYILGPDDQLNINVYGNSLANWRLTVSPEGNINIPGVGVVNVAGKSVELATSAIKSKLAANHYAIGNGTSVQVTLGDIRSIKVIMIGQLVKPGTYTLSSLSTVFNALYAAGGPNANGSFRQIEVIRNNRIIRRLDIYDFLTRGDQKDNISLKDQDIIRVPTYRTHVSMTGQVKTPAVFEMVPGETLQNVINFAGGFTDAAYTARIKVSQVNDQQRRITDIPESDFGSYIPLRGDVYEVDAILNRFENRITVSGAVFRPGDYELSRGLTLSQLIAKAGGLREDAFMNRGVIIRLKPDNTTESISFNLQDVVNKTQDVTLQREDLVNIASIFDLRDQYVVSINGVRHPGNYYYADSMKVQDLILRAGGFPEGASTMRLEVARRIDNSDPHSKDAKVSQVYSININKELTPGQGDFVLHPFDIVSIYTLPGYETQRQVKVEGEVLYPGVYTLEKKNERISDLIKRAGGLTASADAAGGTLKRENTAILGIDPGKADTAAINRDRQNQLNRLKQINRDTTASTNEFRNNYVGIDLPEILSNPGSKADLLLEDNDLLRIPKEQQVVKVNGEVLYPSAVVYSSGKGFKQYIFNAGGFSPYALAKRSYIVYPNGTVRATHKFLFFRNYPSVKPGSEIYVPRKPIKLPGNAAQAILGFTTGLASLGAIILGIISLHKN